MKKMICILLFFVSINSIVCSTNDSEVRDLADSVRDNTGKIEELEKANEEMQKRISLLEDLINKKDSEEAAKKDMEIIAQKTPEELLKMALDMIEENDMDGARKILTSFITKNPSNLYCGMMKFYIGNCYFVEKNYKNAAIEYMNGFKANPSGSKAAETLYKLALCFKQMKDYEKCKSTLKKLISDYPGEFEKKASSELKKIK